LEFFKENNKMKICVLGTGYVGLVAGVALADFGNYVNCVDIDQKKIDMLNDGKIPIYEPGLEKIVQRNIEKKRLFFTTDVIEAVKDVEIIFIAVGTPQGDDGNADLSALRSAAKSVAKAIKGFTVIVNKCTVPVGTADEVQKIFDDNSEHEVVVVSNPEFLKEGNALNDFMKPERIIIGTNDDRARDILHEVYQPFVRSRDRIIDMDPRSAELTKYASNSFLAARISFMNDISNLCDVIGADVEMVRKGMGSDSRIGPKFLYPGIGFGGSCFPKDLSALLYLSRKMDTPLQIVEATPRINETQKSLIVNKLNNYFDDLKGKTIGILGLAFKPNTDDIREAPSHIIVEKLIKAGAKVQCYDPVAMANFKKEHPENENLIYCNNLYEATENADAVCLCTEWHELQRPDFKRIKELMNGNALFDGRNVWSRKEVKKYGFRCEYIGRPLINVDKK
jgi:UDPglucose 6-dehydrogenase